MQINRIPLMVLMVLLLGSLLSAEQLLRIKVDPAPLYTTKQGKESKGDLLKEDKLILLRKGKNRSFVKTLGGIRGWVENANLEKVRLLEQEQSQINLKEINIHGWLENPHALYIFEQHNSEPVAIYLMRNFKEELVEFVDRETMEMAHLENIAYPLPGFYSPLPRKIL